MLKRLPAFNDILQTFALTAFLVYGRMLYLFAWKLPSWLKNLHGDEIFGVLSYSLAVSLLETIGLTVILAAIGTALPAKWFRDDFIARSAWAVTVWLISWMIYFARMASLGSDLGLSFADYLYAWLAVTVMLACLAGFLATRVRFMQSLAAWLADRTLIFLIIFIPASLLGAVAAMVRNL